VVHKYLLEIGFSQLASDLCIYLRSNSHGRTIAGLYVDDFLCAGHPAACEEFKKQMRSRFNIKDLGIAKFVLGIQISQSTKSIEISQATYSSKLVEELGMADCNPTFVLMPGEALTDISNDSGTPVDTTLYRRAVGKLMYAMVGT
jgi:hypothetical protein